MVHTPMLDRTYFIRESAQKHVTHNEALRGQNTLIHLSGEAFAGNTSSPQTNPSPRVCINTPTDATSWLRVKCLLVLFSLDDITDNGDVWIRVNTAPAGDTGSMVFQSNWPDGVEFGLVGANRFRLKVSADRIHLHMAMETDASAVDVIITVVTNNPNGKMGINRHVVIGQSQSVKGLEFDPTGQNHTFFLWN